MSSQSAEISGSSPQRPPSTGPRTEAGKAISSQNARKHDLCSRTLGLTPEEWGEYNGLCSRYRHDFRPANEAEESLIDEICFNYWRLQQAREVEMQIILERPTEVPIIALYIRYRTGYERGFYKALDRLYKCRSEARKQDAPVRSVKPDLPAAPVSAPVPETETPVCSAPAALTPVPPAPVRFADCISSGFGPFQEQVEDHLLENRVRSELLLPPLPLPESLKKEIQQFISKNPTLNHKQFNSLLKQAA